MPFGTILQRMIFRELLKVFLLSLVAITAIFLLAGIVAEASQQGLSPGQILAVIPLLLPSTLPYTIPATTLFATCVVYGRLAGDNEILAIRASGVSLLRIVSPAVVLGLLTSVATMTLYYRVIPYTHHLLRSMFINDVEGMLYTALERNREIRHPEKQYEMYVRGVEGRKLIHPTFKKRNAAGNVETVAQAREAQIIVDMNKREIRIQMRYGSAVGKGGQGSFPEKDFPVPIPNNLHGNKNRRPRDLTWTQLHARRAELEQSIVDLKKDLQKSEGSLTAQNNALWLRKHINDLKNRITSSGREIYSIDAELQMRPALSFGCLFFVLIGCPVGIWFSKSDFLSSFITCFLPIVFLYYPLVLCGTGLAKDGMDPVITVWAADGILFLLSVGLFRQLMRH